MAGELYPRILILCILILVLLGVTIWAMAILRQAYSCRSDPQIKCLVYTCPDASGSDSVARFGDTSELSTAFTNGDCAWLAGENECMKEWCQSNRQTGEVWIPSDKCKVYAK